MARLTWVDVDKETPGENSFVRVWAKLANNDFFGCARFANNRFRVILDDDRYGDAKLLNKTVTVYKWRSLAYNGKAPGRE